MDFDNYEYRETGGYIGGYIEGVNQKYIFNPEVSFNIDLNRSFEILEDYITKSEFEQIKSFIDKFPHKIFKNPAALLLGFIVVKQSGGSQIDGKKLRALHSHNLCEVNNISLYDLLRYSRFYLLSGK